jgi:hypothetical protein
MLPLMHPAHRRRAATLAGVVVTGLGACGSVQPQSVPDAALPDAALPRDAALPVDVGIHGCAPVALITDVQSTDPGYGNACIRGGWTLEASNGTTTPVAVGQPADTALVSPVAIAMGSNPLALSSTFAVHVFGEGQHNVPPKFGYAELFASLNHPSDDEVGTVDASMYTGIQFYGKLSFGATGARLTVANLFTDPVGGRCTPGGTNNNDCYDNPGMDLTVSADWKMYQVPFAGLEQLHYGYPSPVGADFPRSAITHIRWDIGIPDTGNTAPWDLWIDELRFY